MDQNSCVTVQVLTLYPETFPGVLGVGAIGKALRSGLIELKTVDIREFGSGLRAAVDDTPCGGGAGMVLRADVVALALDFAIEQAKKCQEPLIVCPSPRGVKLGQAMLQKWSELTQLIFICGRFEGIDERIYHCYPIHSVSLGDFVLSGGEVAVQAMLEGLLRLRKSVLGNEASLDEESFHNGLLEHPHYTRPVSWRGREVPEVLLSGHHKKIKQWQQEQAEELTKRIRPDLWENYTSRTDKK